MYATASQLDSFNPNANKIQVTNESSVPIIYKTIEAMYNPLRGLTGAEDVVSSTAAVVLEMDGDTMTWFVVISDPSAYFVVVVLVTLPSAPATSV